MEQKMINNVVLVGRLTKDPDLRYTQSGQAVATFTLAVNRNFTNGNGEREADFINCVIWRKSAESLVNYAKKGTLLGVTGRIQTRNYENQQGQRVYVTEVVAENYQLLESKGQSDARGSNEMPKTKNNDWYGDGSRKQNYDNGSNFGNNVSSNNGSNFGSNAGGDPFAGSSNIDIADDDLPF